MTLLNIAAALLSGILVGLGIGGGGISIIYMTGVLSLSQSSAQGINLLLYTTAGTVALSHHIRHSKLDFEFIIPATAAGAIGALPGAILASLVPHGILSKIFGTVMIISALPILFGKSKEK